MTNADPNTQYPVQLPSIHSLVNDISHTKDAMDGLHVQGDYKSAKYPKHDVDAKQGSLPLPSFTDTSNNTSYPSGYRLDSHVAPSPVEPLYKSEVNNWKLSQNGHHRDVPPPRPSSPGQHYRGNYVAENPGRVPIKPPAMHPVASPGQHIPQQIPSIYPTAHQDLALDGQVYPLHHAHVASPQPHALPLSHGTSPVPSMPVYMAPHTQQPMGVPVHPGPDKLEDCEPPIKRRTNLPKDVTNILRQWLNEHVDYPYPTEEDKHRLMSETGLTIVQVSNWFINARRRVLNSNQRKGRHRSSKSNGSSS